MSKKRILIGIPIVLVMVTLGLWGYWNYLAPKPAQNIPTPTNPEEETYPKMVSAEGKVQPYRFAQLAFLQGGVVEEILVARGDKVQQGDPLIRLDDKSLEAAVKQAEATLEVAKANLRLAEAQLTQVEALEHQKNTPARKVAWEEDLPSEIEQPVWYFDKEQSLISAQAELEAATLALEGAKANLSSLQSSAAMPQLLEAERRLANAQAAFIVADQVLERAKESPDEELKEEAQANYDAAESELQAAQATYDQILTTKEAENIMEARARLAIAQERYDTALDRLYALQTGADSIEVKVAQQAVQHAAAAVAQADAALQSARVALENSVLTAPFEGTIVDIDIERGEVATPGYPVILIADLSIWQVKTVDLTEADVALLVPEMSASITLDAFPGSEFDAKISEISFIGEETRGDITFSIILDFNPDKTPVRWGMTAFVEITIP